MIERASSADPRVVELLSHHPKVSTSERSNVPGIEFKQGDWQRSVSQGDHEAQQFGLLELMDNNPLVCADGASIPCPLSILAAIALGPLILSGLLIEEPTVLSSASVSAEDEADLQQTLHGLGWEGGAIVHSTDLELQSVLAATVIAAVLTPDRIEDLDDLYEERFGRSFFVHRHEEGDWDIALVQGSQNAYFRLRIAHDIPHSLLTIQVMADKDGKCGAGALVHAMNVMAGFEESLGL